MLGRSPMKFPYSLVPRSVRDGVKARIRSTAEARAAELFSEMEGRLRAEVDGLRQKLDDAATALAQWESIHRLEAATPPPPPKHLQVRVVGKYVGGFIESGHAICADLQEGLAPAGRRLEDFPRILDFGCGCGRIIRALRTLLPHADLSGTDIDPEAIEWLRRHYGRIASFDLAPHSPPLPYSDGRFDLVLGLSVFTHLPEDMQFAWLHELDRIAAPGALLLLTTHGEKHWGAFPPELLEVMKTKGFYYGDFGFNYGRSISLPDFYQTSYHGHEYLRREWGRTFDVVAIETLRIGGHQDAVLLRKRA